MNSEVIGLIDYGVGNLGSIQRMIERVGGCTSLISNASELSNVKKIILPGVGHYSEGVRALKSLGFWGALLEFSRCENTSIFGICLGMQLLCRHSEEGDIEGLGLVDATVEKFYFPQRLSLKVPHMGWNTLRMVRDNPLLRADNEELRFYFVHSYKVVPKNPEISIGNCEYGGEFCAAFQQNNVFGVQFHPEKSHRFGMALMKRFVEL